eukprot:s47_g4.t1
MGPRKRPAARAPGDDASVGGQPTPTPKKPPRKKRPKKTETDNAEDENAERQAATNAENESTQQQVGQPSQPSEPSGSHADAAPNPKEGITETFEPAAASPKRKASAAKSTAKKGKGNSARVAKKEKAKAKAKQKSRAKKQSADDAVEEKHASHEPNPFDMPPDDDQQKVSSFFPSRKNTDTASNSDKEVKSDDEANQKAGEGGAEGEGQVKKEDDDSNAANAKSQSESSSTSSSSKPSPVPNLGDFEDESGLLPGNSSPCMVQSDQTRSRIQMFSFPARTVQRLKKHYGMKSVQNLDMHLSDATVVSLYSGLGGQASLHRQQLGGVSGPRCAGEAQCQDRRREGTLCSFGRLELIKVQVKVKVKVKVKATQARAAKSKAVKKDKSKIRQARADAKQAKKDLSELSQKLVLELVNMIEDENMLKPAMSRAYSAILRDDWVLQVGLDQLFRLHISAGVDAGSFFAATQAEAKKSVQADWQDLLPVAAQMNLKAAVKLPRMKQLLANSSEVAINLDQDVNVQDRRGGTDPTD